MKEFVTLIELSKAFGVRRAALAARLTDIGLRTPRGMPSEKAMRNGCYKVWNGRFVLWHQRRVIPSLCSVGLMPVARGVIRCGDCLEQLALIPDNSFDGGLSDSPYALTSIVERFGRNGAKPPSSDGRVYGRLAKGFMGHTWDSHIPPVEVWREVLRVLRPGAYLLAFGGTRTSHRLICNIENAGFIIRDTLCWLYGQGFPKSLGISKAVDKYLGAETSESDDWNGYGTALKPAFELIVLAQKPLDGTYAKNVLKWECGGLNIAGCRIGADAIATTNEGRWPANLILDEGAAQLLDQQSGQTTSSRDIGERGTGGIWSKSSGKPCGPQYGDTGGASRFFYCAKASKKERGDNTHPTVKPLALCRYLATLILPPPRQTPRRILVPFSGSGSEMIGALQAGWEEAVGIEREEEYVRTAERRIAAAIPCQHGPG